MTPSSGHLDIDKTGEIDTLIINHTDKVQPLFEKLRDNGGYLELMTGDFSQAAVSNLRVVMMDLPKMSAPPQFRLHLISNRVWINKISLMFTQQLLERIDKIREFNGIAGSVDTTDILPVAGIFYIWFYCFLKR